MNNSNKQKRKETEKILFQIERKKIVNINEILNISQEYSGNNVEYFQIQFTSSVTTFLLKSFIREVS